MGAVKLCSWLLLEMRLLKGQMQRVLEVGVGLILGVALWPVVCGARLRQ